MATVWSVESLRIAYTEKFCKNSNTKLLRYIHTHTLLYEKITNLADASFLLPNAPAFLAKVKVTIGTNKILHPIFSHLPTACSKEDPDKAQTWAELSTLWDTSAGVFLRHSFSVFILPEFFSFCTSPSSCLSQWKQIWMVIRSQMGAKLWILTRGSKNLEVHC